MNEPAAFTGGKLPHPLIALLPLVLVGVSNIVFTWWIPQVYGASHSFVPNPVPMVQEVSRITAIWAVLGALLVGILTVLAFAWKPVLASFAEGSKAAVGGALLAAGNTASEYGFGAVIAALPGFLVVANALGSIPNPLVNEAITVTALAGITGSASGGIDTLPHNGAIITLLAVTGLTHRQSYKDIFAITIVKTSAVFVVIGVFYATGWV